MLNMKTRNKEKGHSLLIYIKFVLISIENMLNYPPAMRLIVHLKKGNKTK